MENLLEKLPLFQPSIKKAFFIRTIFLNPLGSNPQNGRKHLNKFLFLLTADSFQFSQLTFSRSKSTIGTPEKGVKYVQSEQ